MLYLTTQPITRPGLFDVLASYGILIESNARRRVSVTLPLGKVAELVEVYALPALWEEMFQIGTVVVSEKLPEQVSLSGHSRKIPTQEAADE